MKQYLTVPEVAAALGRTPRAVWHGIYRGEIPHRRWGRRVLVSEDELQKFLDALPGRTADEAVAAVGERQ
jgi:excisionase family DNA binding protein